MTGESPHFENSIPILYVNSLDQSIRYYTDMLGFSVDWHLDSMASLSRDAATVMLCDQCQGSPGSWVWIGVSDAAALFEEYKQKNVNIIMEPANFPWALEMRITDLNGHVLRFGSDPLN